MYSFCSLDLRQQSVKKVFELVRMMISGRDR
jgi:hypothetical protein